MAPRRPVVSASTRKDLMAPGRAVVSKKRIMCSSYCVAENGGPGELLLLLGFPSDDGVHACIQTMSC